MNGYIQALGNQQVYIEALDIRYNDQADTYEFHDNDILYNYYDNFTSCSSSWHQGLQIQKEGKRVRDKRA